MTEIQRRSIRNNTPGGRSSSNKRLNTTSKKNKEGLATRLFKGQRTAKRKENLKELALKLKRYGDLELQETKIK